VAPCLCACQHKNLKKNILTEKSVGMCMDIVKSKAKLIEFLFRVLAGASSSIYCSLDYNYNYILNIKTVSRVWKKPYRSRVCVYPCNDL
jgi:hypothetical protein